MAITNIYKGALERSDIQKIYKGTTLLYEKVLPPQGETWVLNDTLTLSAFSYSVNFVDEDSASYVGIEARFNQDIMGMALYYDGYWLVYDVYGGWFESAYRTITFETAPTGDLLTWLEANAVKQ